MVLYWDQAAAWNFILDYLLLLGSLRLAGLPPRRKRLVPAAALGAAYSVAAAAAPLPAWTVFPALLLICRVAYGKTKRIWKLTLLTALLACGLGGAVVLLGRELLLGTIPWGVFLGAGALCWCLTGSVFRGDAANDAGARVSARIELRGSSVTLTLLRDTGNALLDPMTGKNVPVAARDALDALPLSTAETTVLRCRTVHGIGELSAFRCDGLWIDGRALGPCLVALMEEPPGGGCQGLWNEREDENELETLVETHSHVA